MAMNGYGSRQQYDDPGYDGALSPQYGAPTIGRVDFSGQNVEMASLAQNGSQFAQQQNPNFILNACAQVNELIARVNQSIVSLQTLQKLSLDAVSDIQQSKTKKQIDDLSSDVMAQFRNITGEVKEIKLQPAASLQKNAPQVERLSRAVLNARRNYEQSDATYRKQIEAQIARQVKIVRPDATEQEIRAAVEDPDNQIFSQALMQSDRQGQAQSTRNNVRQRHEEIQKIERQMIELAELFEDMNNLVIQQEEAIADIEMKGEQVVENVDKGTEEIGVAIQSAKNTRKWKWWCLGIVVLIISALISIVVIYKYVTAAPLPAQPTPNGSSKSEKRFFLSDAEDTPTPLTLAVEAVGTNSLRTIRTRSRLFRT